MIGNFGIDQQFESIKRSAVDAVKAVFPMKGKTRTIALDRVWVEDTLSSNDYKKQLSIKERNGTFGVPVYAALRFIDNSSGKEIDREEKVKLFTLPKITDRFSYIVGGNEYQVSNQLRRKSGVYTLRKQNGELKTSVNLAKGKNFDIEYDENKALFNITKVGGGQQKIPLYPVLVEMGLSHNIIARELGADVARANQSSDPKVVSRLKAALNLKPQQKLSTYFSSTQIDPETTNDLLGKSFDSVDGMLLLKSASNLLKTHLGKREPDDPNSLATKELHSIEDFIAERIEKNKNALIYKVRRNIDNPRKNKLAQVISPGAFSSTVEGFFLNDSKSATPEQTNPLAMISGQYKTTIMGEGGIQSDHAITEDVRNVHPTHYGFIDPVHTPECYDEKTEVFTKQGWVFWKDVGENTEFACLIDESLEFHKAEKVIKTPYSGILYGAKNSKIDYLVTPNHRMLVRPLDSKEDSWRVEFAEDMHMVNRTLKTTHYPYEGQDKEGRVFLEHVQGSNAIKNVNSIDAKDWCAFLGWFLSEGSYKFNEEKSDYLVKISQSKTANPSNCEEIEELLSRLPWKWCYTDSGDYVLGVKQLANALKDQGLCYDKYIPEEVFEFSIAARWELFKSLIKGDGRDGSVRKTGVSYKQQVFCTTSKKLADGFEKLAISLGLSVSTKKYSDSREDRYADVYECRVQQRTVRSVRKFNHRSKRSDYYTTNYHGMVYCATVPGSFLLVRRNGSVPIWSGNSGKIGANLHLPLGVQKDGNTIKAFYKDKNGNNVKLSSKEAYEKRVAFPNQTPVNGKVKVLYRGKVEEVSPSQVDLYTPDHKAIFSVSTNLVPFLQNDQGNRTMMAAKMHEQAISLKYREKPLVQVEANPGKSMENLIGERLALKSPVDGTIVKIDADQIVIKDDQGQKHEINKYNNFHLNRKSFLHHDTSGLKVGDRVTKGQLLADSNFTKDGDLALGVNLKTAYLPYKGYNFEDGIVITESAAKKLTSEHVYKNSLKTTGGNILTNLRTFKAHYPNLISPQNMQKLDEDGVIKQGVKVEPGETLIAALQKQDGGNSQVGLFSKKLFTRPKNVSITWDKETPGVIQKVVKNRGEYVVFVQTEEQAVVGDKLAGRHGNKGVITKIIRDADAPKTKDGEPVDMLLNPHGVISRINIGQIYESAAAKAADKKGAPTMVRNFSGENFLEKVKGDLKSVGISDKEDLFDPTGKKLGKVHVGKPHFLKLFKQTSANFSAREGGAGQPYDLNQQPLKLGGDESPKTMDMLTMYSMLSHGARENLRETASIKSQQNDEYWSALKSGRMLPPPQNPFVFDKFIGYLKASGVDVKKDGSKMTLAPLTDKQVEELSKGEVKKPVFYRAKDMKEEPGGFFDKAKFGGLRGDKWGHLTLQEPVVNPVFESAVKKITGLGTKYDKLVEGKAFLHPDGKIKSEAGKDALTGGNAIKKILKEMDVEKELNSTLKKLEGTQSKSTRDSLNKKARYLTALKKTGLDPDEAYMRQKMPVLPPQYRPLYQLPDGNITTSDVNFLYQNVGVLNEMMKQPVMDLLPEEEKADIRKEMTDHMRAVSGITDQSIKGRERKGFISQIAGPQPKKGFFIDKVLAKQQDYAGRGTIIPEPTLGVDEMGMPETMAWKLFKPFLIRELRKFGKSPNEATKEIENKTPLARKALDKVMADRTVMLNRAPSLHKFSIMAFKPKLVEGKSIKIPPLVVKGFNADFDGDTMTIHTPISDKAVEESKKMFPSKNLYKPGTGDLMIAPDQESQMGLYYLSKTPAGRAKVNKILGDKFSVNKQLTGKETKDLLMRISKEDPNSFGRIVGELKTLGEDHAYDVGFSLGLDDLDVASKERDKIVKKFGDLAKKNPDKVDMLNVKATDMVNKLLDQQLKGKKNSFYDMVEAGAKGKKSQLRSILATPLFVADAQNKTIPNIISKSYTEGLDIPDYWQSLYGARKGMIDRSVQTSIPGAYSKDIINNTIDMVVSKDDCGTTEGIDLKPDDSDILGRYLAIDHGVIKRNTLVDTNIANRLKKTQFKTIKVRSPLTCEQEKGVCAKCHGIDEHMKDPEIGDNVGAKAGQSIAEPLIQMTMNSFHTGGVAGTGINASGIARIDQLLKMPKVVVGAARLSPVDGTVLSIKEGVGGGKEITLQGNDGQKHVIKTPQGRELKVSMGSRVRRGDALNEGPIRPQDLVSTKGMLPAQRYMVDELQKEYRAQGPNIEKRTFENLVRSITDTTVVLNNPRTHDAIPGDITSYRAVQQYNKNLVEEIPVEDADGLDLAEAVGTLPAGKTIGKREIDLLKAMGYSKIKIKKDPIQHEPVVKNITTLPILKDDWMSSLGYRDLKRVIQEGAAKGLSTDLHGYNPIPAYAAGTEFGRGKDGKY